MNVVLVIGMTIIRFIYISKTKVFFFSVLEIWIFSRQSGHFECLLNSSDWLERSRLSKQATYFSDM